MAKKVIFDKKIVLVTGGAGFIGSHLCDELLKTAKVICLDDFSSGTEVNIDHLLDNPDFEFIKHDLVEPVYLEELPELQKFKIKFQGIQEIYHLACPMSVKNFQNNKVKILNSNSTATRNALELARQYNAKFLFFSSSVVYGPREKNSGRIKEDNIGHVDFLSERSAYDEGKRFAETMIVNYRQAYNMDAKIIRLFRTYGPRMMLNDGQMIPDFISNTLDGKDLVIYGDENFSTSLCYITDVVAAAIKMMASDLTGPINIGSDVEVNLTELAKQIQKKIGKKTKIRYEDELLFITPLCLPDISLARNELGWIPIVPLEKGISETIYHLETSKGLKSFSPML